MRLSPPTAPSFGASPHFGVPGGMCGVPYDHRISVPPELRLRAVYLDERCGLRASSQEPGRLLGTPTLDGTHVLRLECVDAAGATVLGEARLVISRDPRSLWRNVPSDRRSPHWKPDHASVQAQCRGWRVYGLSRRGRSHANTGKCREDDLAVRVVGEQMIAVAVADGAGSASLARLGSRIAVEAAMQVLLGGPALTPSAEHLQVYLASAAVAASHALESVALEQGIALTELSTTLLLCLLVPAPVPLFACLQIGDGVIATGDDDGIRPLAAPDRGEYASQTRFLSAARVQPEELAARITVHALRSPRWVIAATDGVSDPYLETEQALHEPACWAPIDAVLAQAAAAPDADAGEQLLTQWLDGFTPGHHDDRTLVLLQAEAPAVRGPA